MNQHISRRSILTTGAAVAGAMALGVHVQAADQPKRRVVVWSEGTAPKNIYPKDINTVIAEGLQKDLDGWDIVIANLSDPDQGLADDRLNSTDVLMWWGHQKHADVKDELVKKIVKRVNEDGMGFIALHSAHFAKPNRALMGSPCSWSAYVVDSTNLKVIVTAPKHPIAQGVSDFDIVHEERYGNPYMVPMPQTLVFDGIYVRKDGKLLPSELVFCWTRGKGKMFYFQVGHETNPIFFDANVRKIMKNAVAWAAK